ncbi:hypothetical protein HMPREF9504_02547 [Enterococcus faecalis TX0102]|uniref:YobI family P-loop NTPase n=1 Tax=Enterococcus faecalis TaxID=1351 RepID=UPI0001E71811|nr:hypothetical protein [Enterococcus faecalis]EFQ11940.1 hypothetical protein HMPREF9504_02547 [Enterococcus faecalis TX0102]EFT96131.1 hypothetical protein HMPREF9502_02533 [Enterococcus faecalis TX0031]HBI3718238.1 hypothetical protein [Enterococcus faecalis]
MLKREKKNLLLIIEDIDRYENLKIFQQLREVNNLLNGNDEENSYKFIYAVGNSLFSEYSRNDEVNIRKVYQSDFKSRVTKFFDFVVNVTPVMDNQNSYEFIKKHFPHILDGNNMVDEDLFMISQYINSPRILIDVVNDYQIMKDMHHEKEGFQDLKLFYYAILKSRFYNFYDLIHEVFTDLQSIADLYDNNKEYILLEHNREEEFLSYCLLYIKKRNSNENGNIQNLTRIWNTVKDEQDFSSVSEEYGGLEIHTAYSTHIYLEELLEKISEDQMEFLFSAEEYRKQRGSDIPSSSKSIAEIISLYYKENRKLILKIIKDVENSRQRNPNRPNFSIREFLDIDYIQLGIREGILDANDYNMYISSNYLEVNDAMFIKSFNLYDTQTNFFTLQLYDFDTILSKMKLEKIVGSNGLNVFILEWMYTKDLLSDKITQLKINAVNHPIFLQTLLDFNFENGMDKFDFILKNINELKNKKALEKLTKWLNHNSESIDNDTIEGILKQISIKNTVPLVGTEFKEFLYLILIEQSIANLSTSSTLSYILNKVKMGYKSLLNPILKKYEGLIFRNENFDNHEWLTTLNNDISSFIPIFDDESADIVKRAYKLVDEIKVKELSTINDSDFLMFIYEHNYYEFSYDNITFIRRKLESKSIKKYEVYTEYLIQNSTKLREFIKGNGELLNLSNKWDEDFLFRWLRSCDESEFENVIQFIISFNPVIFPSLEDLELSFDKVNRISKHVKLYEHSYKNILFVYESLIEEGETQFELIDSIFGNEDFDFEVFYKDQNLFNQNEELESKIYIGILRNDAIQIEIFERYIVLYDDRLESIEHITSKEKLVILFKHDKVEYSFDNFLLCDSEVLLYLLEEKKNEVYSEMLGWNTDEVVKILKKIDDVEKQREGISLLLSDSRAGKEYSIDLIVNYLKALDIPILASEFENEVIRMLNELRFNKKEAEKIVSLISNHKGQRTVSVDFLAIVKLLNEKKLIEYEINSDKVIIKYKVR